MENQFVPFELAVKLKKLGFDRPVLGWYNASKELSYENRYGALSLIDAPLWQQAFDWFRDKHNNPSSISHFGRFGFSFVINYSDNRDFEYRENYHRWNYEEARQACLEKLIELTELNN